jgi:hypothetical protein
VYKWTNNKYCLVNIEKSTTVDNPHGTAIGGIIQKNIDSNERIIFFDIFSEDSLQQLFLLKQALKFINKTFSSGVINCSMGTLINDNELYEVVVSVTKKIKIIAAFDNAGAISYPAAYDSVIGVDTSYRCTHKEDYVVVENSPINIKAKGGVQRVPWVNPEFTINQGSSFACAYITAYIVNNHYHDSMEQTLSLMKNKARFVYEFEENKINDIELNIQSAAIVPFNKETQNLINFKNLLDFRVEGLYDYKFSGNIGRKYQSFYSPDITETIRGIQSIDFEKIDWLIIGHLEELSNFVNKNLKLDLLKKCLESQTNVYCFDSLHTNNLKKKFNELDLKLICADDLCIKTPQKFGKLMTSKKPILGVFGTAKKQGKFTLQLQLRNVLKKMNYCVRQIGTEPTSHLYGFDYSYPFGYLGKSTLTPYKIIEDTNNMIGMLEESTETDIIIVGSQSGTIPQSFGNLGHIPIQQLSFLLGSNPDSILLCVNYDDDLEYVKRTILSLENLTYTKVIGIGLYPFAYKNGWGIINDKKEKVSKLDIEKKIKELDKNFNVYSFEIGNSIYEKKLVDVIENFFT